MSKENKAAASSMSLLERATGSPTPVLERMPTADLRIQLPMRDGVRLATWIWLPRDATPAASVLMRTPYKEGVLGWKRLGLMKYVEAGFAVVVQLVRGIGESEGRFGFNAPHDRTDGYDTVEWIASQAWCSGSVGMDGSSYLGMTQIAAASARPPHLKCIIPAVPSVDFFKEIPYNGGIFSRVHTINWAHLLQIDSLAEQRGGFMSAMPILSQPDYLQRMTSRPLTAAADGELAGDLLQHYSDCLAHPTFDDWWRERSNGPEEFKNIDIPMLVVAGNFDPSVGALTLWRGVEAHAANPEHRMLLLGPWDHGQCYVGGGSSYGPYQLGSEAGIDMAALRIRFFDKHLRGKGPGIELGGRVRVFFTGVNEWVSYDQFPPREGGVRSLYLQSSGHANSARGDGLLSVVPSERTEADAFLDDPERPFVPAIASATGAAWVFDMAEYERHHETLVYDTGPLSQPIRILGESELVLHTSADVPDADLVAHLVERRADGSSIRLAFGALRLTHRNGMHRRELLQPDEIVEAKISLTYIAHELPAGSSLRLLVSGGLFPLFDPNPHGSEPVASATVMRPSMQKLHHGPDLKSVLKLPTVSL